MLTAIFINNLPWNGRILIPIVVPAVSGNQYCPFGWSAAIGVSLNAQGQPYCTTARLQAQIANAANNPLLNVIPKEFMDPAALSLLAYMNPASSYFLDNGAVRNLFTVREATQNESRYTLRIDHNITSKERATFRWTKTPAVGIRTSNGSDINGNQGIYSDAVQYLGTVNSQFTANMTNEARFQLYPWHLQRGLLARIFDHGRPKYFNRPGNKESYSRRHAAFDRVGK